MAASGPRVQTLPSAEPNGWPIPAHALCHAVAEKAAADDAWDSPISSDGLPP